MTLREDSDIVARHGFVEKRETPMTFSEMKEIYSQIPHKPSSYYLPEYNQNIRHRPAPIVWFVSHCNDFNGRYIELWSEISFPQCTFNVLGLNMLSGLKNTFLWIFTVNVGQSHVGRIRIWGTCILSIKIPVSTWSTETTGST